MEPLSPAARAFLAMAKRGEAPSAADQERVQAALLAALTAPIPSDVPSPSKSPSPKGAAASLLGRSVPMPRVLGALAVVFAAGVATGHAVTRSSTVTHVLRPPVVTTLATKPSEVAAAASPIATAKDAAPERLPSAATGAPGLGAKALHSASSLPSASVVPSLDADEARSILRAKRSLSAGDPGQALRELEVHERTYPHGTLSEERDALRVLALCAMGRPEGAGERARFLGSRPLSPYFARVQSACTSNRDP